MPDILNFLNTNEKMILSAGLLLVVLGLLTPTKVLGIEFIWPPRKGFWAVLLGFVLVVLSLPQIRNYNVAPPERVDLAMIVSIRDAVIAAKNDAAGAASNWGDHKGCLAAGASSAGKGDGAVRLIDKFYADVAAQRAVPPKS